MHVVASTSLGGASSSCAIGQIEVSAKQIAFVSNSFNLMQDREASKGESLQHSQYSTAEVLLELQFFHISIGFAGLFFSYLYFCIKHMKK